MLMKTNKLKIVWVDVDDKKDGYGTWDSGHGPSPAEGLRPAGGTQGSGFLRELTEASMNRFAPVGHGLKWQLLLSALLTILLLGFGAQPAAAQDNISGVWAADLSTGDGNILRA